MSKSTSSSSKPILTVAEKQALRDWLVLHEFRANPFDVRVAEHEAKREPYLHTYFISTPYYDEIREAQTLKEKNYSYDRVLRSSDKIRAPID